MRAMATLRSRPRSRSRRRPLTGNVRVWLLGLTCVLVSPAACELTIDESRALAQRHAQTSLDGIEPTTEAIGDSQILTFKLNQPPISYRVNATEEYFLGWLRRDSRAPTGSGLTEDQAKALATATAVKEAGEEARSLTWAVTTQPGGYALVVSTGPQLGDPPRTGLSLSVMVGILPDGTVMSYQQILPAKEDSVPALVAVSGDEARRIALEHLGLPGFHATPAELSQRRGRVEWHTQLTDDTESRPPSRAPRSVWYTIDARDGVVIERHFAMSSGWPERGYPTSTKQPHPLPYWIRRHGALAGAAAGVAGLCFAALVVVRVARRRARA